MWINGASTIWEWLWILKLGRDILYTAIIMICLIPNEEKHLSVVIDWEPSLGASRLDDDIVGVAKQSYGITSWEL